MEVPDDRPLSWAELAKKKLQANGSAEASQSSKGKRKHFTALSSYSQTLSGPAKPKLVSKASGHDLQPWKMQANTPKISAKEVPSHLRPLLSCALWRMHESIDRNDSNQIFLLSDQEEVRLAAKNLNMTVRSVRELSKRISASIKHDDLNVTGMLEKENLVKPKDGVNTGVPSPLTSNNDKKEKIPDSSIISDPRPYADVPGPIAGINNMGATDHSEVSMQQKPTDGAQPRLEKEPDVKNEQLIFQVGSDQAESITLDPRKLVQDLLRPPEMQSQFQHAIETKGSQDDAKTANHLQPSAEIMEASPDRSNATPKTASDMSPAKPPPATAEENVEDSDEEVVVFVPNPKRMSAHRKAATSNSRPNTAHGELSTSPLQGSPRPSTSNAQGPWKGAEHGSLHLQKPVDGHSRRLSSDAAIKRPEYGASGVKANPQMHPRPRSSGPTVIDPDAFGRGLPVNTGAGTRANANPSNRSRRHSPRNSLQNAGHNVGHNTGRNSGSPQIQDSSRTSPSRHKHSRQPPSGSRAPPQKITDSPPKNVPVISHQAYTRAPLVAPSPQPTPKSHFGAIRPPSKSAINLQVSASPQESDTFKSHQSSIQRPRSAHGSGPNGNVSIQPRRQAPKFDSVNGSPAPSGRNGNNDREQQRSSRPSLFEPELDRTGAGNDAEFEPRRTRMPEVQYTLKSGTTREAARGKGKLWTG